MTTFCEDCDGVVEESRKRLPSNWLCIHFRRLEGQGFVSPRAWAEMEPYMRCVNINGGACPMFSQRRQPEQQL
jgi:hypothetical protein